MDASLKCIPEHQCGFFRVFRNRIKSGIDRRRVLLMLGFGNLYGPNAVGTTAIGPGQYVVYSQIRERLTGARVYYVRTDGSDSNNGLSDTASGAFLTLQHAVDIALQLDANNFNVTIQIRTGTYAGANILAPLFGLGSATFLITGDTTTPTNVVVNAASSGNSIGAFNGASISLSGISAVTPGFACLQAGNGAIIQCVDKMDFGSSLYHLEAQRGGVLTASGISYSISGSPTDSHVRSNNLGLVDTSFSTTTFTADITVVRFVLSEFLAVYKATNQTFTLGGHTVTGSRYTVTNGAVINTGTTNTTYFPGSTGGTGTDYSTSPWGLYL